MKYFWSGQEIQWEDKFICPLCGTELLMKKDKACAKKRYLGCKNRAGCNFRSDHVRMEGEE